MEILVKLQKKQKFFGFAGFLNLFSKSDVRPGHSSNSIKYRIKFSISSSSWDFRSTPRPWWKSWWNFEKSKTSVGFKTFWIFSRNQTSVRDIQVTRSNTELNSLCHPVVRIFGQRLVLDGNHHETSKKAEILHVWRVFDYFLQIRSQSWRFNELYRLEN